MFYFFLVFHAESLFLVQNQQPKVFEFHVRRQQPVRAYHEVYGTVRQPVQRGFRFFRRSETVEYGNLHPERFEAFQRGIVMLIAQHRAGAHQRRLFAAQYTKIRRAERHFGFSETHVAAQQTVHHLSAAHIRLDFRHAVRLVGRQLVGKRLFEFAHERLIFGKRIPVVFRARRIQRFQIERHFLYGGFHACLHPFEFRSAYLTQRRMIPADVFRKRVHILHGHVQRVAVFVFECDVFFRAVGRFYLFRTDHAPHAVRFVHRVVAHFGRRKQIAAAALHPLLLHGLRVQIARAYRHKLRLVQNKAFIQRLARQPHRVQRVEIGGRLRGHVRVRKRFAHFRQTIFVPAEQYRAIPAFQPVFKVGDQLRRRVQIPADGRYAEIENFQRRKEKRIPRKRLHRREPEFFQPVVKRLLFRQLPVRKT